MEIRKGRVCCRVVNSTETMGSEYRLGTIPYKKRASLSWGPCAICQTKARMFAAMMATLTNGKCSERLTSRIGIIVFQYTSNSNQLQGYLSPIASVFMTSLGL